MDTSNSFMRSSLGTSMEPHVDQPMTSPLLEKKEETGLLTKPRMLGSNPMKGGMFYKAFFYATFIIIIIIATAVISYMMGFNAGSEAALADQNTNTTPAVIEPTGKTVSTNNLGGSDHFPDSFPVSTPVLNSDVPDNLLP